MTTFAVLATGPSMTAEIAASVQGRCGVVAVSDSFRLAPWADALVSTDGKWWQHHPDAANFAGEKFTGAPDFVTLDASIQRLSFGTNINSGLLAMHAAVKLGATRLLLLGFDMHGSHYFGPHPAPLKNTSADRFEAFQEQFKRFKPRGVEIVNCTVGSKLRAYRIGDLACELG